MMQALRQGDSEALGGALHNDLQRAAVSLRPQLSQVLDVGIEYGALGGLVSGSGPTVAFLARDHEQALDLSVALTASGVCSQVRRAAGPVPGARIAELPRIR
jgi:4-diphosphocytidyl-2-C-methyl-D-erythritol kinase